MKWAALITWVLTAGGGFVMLGLWLKHGGLGQRESSDRRIRPALIFGHLALAASGLVLWIVYVVSDSEPLGWAAVALLVPVALLGFTMLAIWLQQRRGEPQPATTTASGPGAGVEEPAEQRFPVAIVVGHGLLAVATLALAFLAVAGVGGS